MGKDFGACCNPFNKPAHINYQNVLEITEAMIAKANEQNIRLKKKDYICDSCRTRN